MALQKLHHVRVATPDLTNTERFALDFGLIVAARENGKTYFRNCGPDSYSYVTQHAEAPRLLEIAFCVDSIDDLHQATANKGASTIFPLTGPGGGMAVSWTAPDDVTVSLVFGILQQAPIETRPDLINNLGRERPRKGRSQHFRPVGPAQLLRLGHVGLFTADLGATRRWYQDVLGLLPSDEMYIGATGNLVCSFMRIDRADEWVDHHALALFHSQKNDLHHISFEVADYEAQFMAHRHMQATGWELVWGVGRHPLGSHVFDMWRDPNRFRFETFSDTDLVQSTHPSRLHNALEQEMDVWSLPGPPDRYFA